MTSEQEEQLIHEETDEIIQKQEEIRQQAIKTESERRSALYFKKNKKEIDRLKKHASDSLITNNKDGYIYSIRKLRKITFQKPLSDDVLKSLFITSKEKVDELIRTELEKENK